MKYCDLVRSNQNFHTSVNLQFDLNKEEKINTYIPTQQSVAILKRYLNSVYNDSFNEDNATVLIGPYGRGKSHLLLVLVSIISSFADKKSERISSLVEKITKVDPDAGELAQMIIKKNKPMLPVLISSNHTNINQAFTVALRETLERENLSDFFPQTYFNSSLEMIKTWEVDFINAFALFKEELKKRKIRIDDFKDRLHKCDTEAYHLFCEIYHIVSNGAEFNPLQNTDVVKMYCQVSEALLEQSAYGGLYIIFDEFSKFLSSATAMSDKQNLKIIQDFAEIAVRNSNIHICFITHKEILDYSQSEDFRTVDGRLKKVYFVASTEQSYELVANALTYSEDFKDFYVRNKKKFESVSQLSLMTGVFNNIPDESFNQLLTRGCFPLLPISVFLLIRISELVGQNERTLFTFLSQAEEYSLISFLDQQINKQDIEFLTPDWIFDYFSELFRVEVFNPKIHSIWVKARAAISRCSDNNQKKLVKILAVCLMINDDNFTSSDINLKASAGLTDKDYRNAMDSLCLNHIITKRRNETYAFLTPNGVDIKKSIQDIIGLGSVKRNRAEIIKKAYSTPFILPRQHNSKHNIMRYFVTAFMEIEDFWSYRGDFSELKNQADGLIVYMITDQDEDTEKVLAHLKKLKSPENILVCVADRWKDDSLILEYQAACLLEKQAYASNDEHFAEELQVYTYDLFKSIQQMADKTYAASNPNTIYCNSNKCFGSITKNMMLNRELSQICDEFYSRTPSINNEMINKNCLTAQIKKARIKVIDWILNSPDEICLMEGFGPEVSLLRSTIFVKQLEKGVNTSDDSLKEVIDLIDKVLISAEGKRVKFKCIYQLLQAEPYGMRKGVIPIYISYVMRKKSDSIILTYKNKEVSLGGEILSQVENSPEDYSFYVEIGTKQKEEFLNKLNTVFIDLGDQISGNKSRAIVDSMQRWFRGLCKFTRDHTKSYGADEEFDIPGEFIKLKKYLLQYDVNPHEFLFSSIPNIFETNELSVVGNRLEEYKKVYDSFLYDTKVIFANRTKSLFDSSISGSLTSVMNDWYDSLSEISKAHVFSADVNTFLHFVKTNDSHDDIDVFEKLAKCITMLSVEDWGENTVSAFFYDVADFIKSVEEYTENENTDGNCSVTMSLDFDGTIYERSIASTEISGIAETALNNIEFELADYGDAISAQERIALLLKLLKKEIDQM